MSQILIEKDHSMSKDEAKRAITEAFEKDLEEFDIDASWKGNVCELTGKGASGAFVIESNKVTFEFKMSILARSSGIDADFLEEEVRRRMDSALR